MGTESFSYTAAVPLTIYRNTLHDQSQEKCHLNVHFFIKVHSTARLKTFSFTESSLLAHTCPPSCTSTISSLSISKWITGFIYCMHTTSMKQTVMVTLWYYYIWIWYTTYLSPFFWSAFLGCWQIMKSKDFLKQNIVIKWHSSNHDENTGREQ